MTAATAVATAAGHKIPLRAWQGVSRVRETQEMAETRQDSEALLSEAFTLRALPEQLREI